MKELKFKVWDKENKILLKRDIAIDHEGGLFKIEYLGEYNEVASMEEVGQENYEIMQWSGLKDCDGREIFEGDILYDSHLDEKYVVKFEEGSYVMEETEAGTTSEIDTDTEIIGNIHENPELLGGSDG